MEKLLAYQTYCFQAIVLTRFKIERASALMRKALGNVIARSDATRQSAPGTCIAPTHGTLVPLWLTLLTLKRVESREQIAVVLQKKIMKIEE